MPQCDHSMSISPTVSPIAGSDGGNGHGNHKLREALSSKCDVLPAIDARGSHLGEMVLLELTEALQ